MFLKRKITKQNLRLAKNLRKVRKAKDVTQEILAEKVGVSPGWISKIERGIYPPNMKLLTKIARALDVKVRDLIPF